MRRILPLLAAAALVPALVAQNLVLPDNHHLMERVDQLANAGDTTHWRATSGGRFQIVYDASHFLNAGVNGPILITHLRFRGEDGEPNLGGQVYSGVTVEVGSTSLGTLSTTFATNRLAATTTMGPLATTNVTVAPSLGTCPNNDCIEIDLLAIGASFVFDPTSAQPNLIVDITMPTPPANAVPLYMTPIQDTTAHGAGIRGGSVSTATATAATGTADTTPAVLGIGFAGNGGYATIVPARNEEFGAACGGNCAAFYQTFNQGQPFDLQAGLTLLPDNPTAPNYYTVVGGAPAVDMTQLNATPNSIADEALVTFPLSFAWAFPGGATSTIKPSTNGHVWLDSAPTAPLYQVNKDNLLGVTTNHPARYMPFWTDLQCGKNNGGNALAGLHVKEDTTGGPGNSVVYVTWNEVGLFRHGAGTTQPGHCIYTFQLVLHQASGMVEYRYGAMNPFASGLWTTTTSMHYSSIVGFTRGRIGGTAPSLDPQSRDLSAEVPFDTSVEGSVGNVGITAVSTPIAGGPGYQGRLFAGQSVRWDVKNIPAGTVIGLLNLDVAATSPGFGLPGITAPGCRISTSLNPVGLQWELFVLPTANVTGTVPLTMPTPVPTAWLGVDIVVQAIGVDLFGGANLVPWSSNAIRHTIGLD